MTLIIVGFETFFLVLLFFKEPVIIDDLFLCFNALVVEILGIVKIQRKTTFVHYIILNIWVLG